METPLIRPPAVHTHQAGLAPSHRGSAATLLFAWCGAAVFAGSLIFFLYSYFVRFGRSRADGPAARAVALDLLLFTVFALHHSLLARSPFKARMRRLVTPPLERAVYTWTASVLFLVVCAGWRFIPYEVYRLTGPLAAAGYAIQLLGVGLTARTSARLDVLDLAGVRPLLDARDGREPAHVPLETSGLYGIVRHPLYLGWVLVVFGAPHMTMTRLVFAIVSTAYLAAAVPFEERSLTAAFGREYEAYRQRVRWRIVPGLY